MLLAKKSWFCKFFFLTAAFFTISLSLVPDLAKTSVPKAASSCCCGPNVCQCAESCGTTHVAKTPLPASAQLVWQSVVCSPQSETMLGLIIIPKLYVLTFIKLQEPIFQKPQFLTNIQEKRYGIDADKKIKPPQQPS